MAGKKGRSGRPRSGGAKQTAVFSTRLKPETRKALDRIAKRNKRSMSQQIEVWVTAEIQGNPQWIKKAFAGDKRNRALAALVSEAMRWFSNEESSRELEGKERWWMDEPFSFGAFTNCVISLLDAIKPQEKPISHPAAIGFIERTLRTTLNKDEKSPQTLMKIYGGIIAAMLLLDLKHNKPMDDPTSPFANWDAVFPMIRDDLNLADKLRGLGESDK